MKTFSAEHFCVYVYVPGAWRINLDVQTDFVAGFSRENCQNISTGCVRRNEVGWISFAVFAVGANKACGIF